jgi:hypothetical protein
VLPDQQIRVLVSLLSLLFCVAISVEAQGTWLEKGPELGGRLSSIVVSGSNPNLLLTASPGGGVWRSVDGGKSWMFPANAGLADYSVTHLEWDVAGGNRLFALTWNSLYESTNNADSWTEVINSDGSPSPLRQGETIAIPDPKPFVQLPFSARVRVVIAAVPCSGIYYSFDGTHFRQHWPFPDGNKNAENCISAITADPDTHIVYISSGVRGGPAHLFRSDCGGVGWTMNKPCLTWVKANAGLPQNSVVTDVTWVGDERGSKPNGGALVAMLVAGGSNATIYMSRDGNSWKAQGNVPTPSWSGRALVASRPGQDLFQGNVGSLYSNDLGATWQKFGVNGQHADVRDIFANVKDGKVWIVSDGSGGGGNGNIIRWDWKPGSAPVPGSGVNMGHSGLKVWQAYFVGLASTGKSGVRERVFLGSQDNGSLCSDSLGDTWKTAGAPANGGAGDQFAYQTAPSNLNRAYALSNTNGFGRTNNAGSATSCEAVSWTFVKPGSGEMGAPLFWSHHALAVHPTNPDAVYFAFMNGVGVMMNGGAPSPTITVHKLPNRAQPTVVYADAKGTIYAGTLRSGAFVSRDDGNTWSPWALNSNSPFLITAITSSGGPSPTFWIATSNGLYRKSPGTAEWTLANNLPGYTVSDVKIDPACPSRVYAAYGFIATWGQHRGGIDLSSDNGATWKSITAGNAIHSVPITDIEIVPTASQRLFAATYGRGLWVYDWGNNLPACRR